MAFGNRLINTGSVSVPLLNYRFGLYTQDTYKGDGGFLRHSLYVWNGSTWDLWNVTDLSQSTYPNTNAIAPCIGLPEGALVKLVSQRIGTICCSVWSQNLNRRPQDLLTSSGYVQYGGYGTYANLTTSFTTAECIFYVTTPAGTQDYPACPVL